MTNRFLSYNTTVDLAKEYTLEKVNDHLDGVLDVNLVSSSATTDVILTDVNFATTQTNNLEIDLINLNGNIISVNSGNLDSGVQRVAIATDDVNQSVINTNTGTIAGDTTSLDTKIPSQGQALMASSLPVAIASDQSILNVNVVSSIFPNPSTDHVQLRAGLITGFENQLLRCYTSGLSASGGNTSFADGMAVSTTFTINDTVFAINTTDIGGSSSNNTSSIEIEYYPLFSSTSTSTFQHTFVDAANGDNLGISWARIKEIRAITGNGLTGIIYIGDATFSAGVPSVFYASIDGPHGLSRSAMFYVPVNKRGSLKTAVISSASTVIGSIYKVTAELFPNSQDVNLFSQNIFQFNISNTSSNVDLTHLDELPGNSTLHVLIQRLNGTNNQEQICDFNIVLRTP